jgi:hypothetical protein
MTQLLRQSAQKGELLPWRSRPGAPTREERDFASPRGRQGCRRIRAGSRPSVWGVDVMQMDAASRHSAAGVVGATISRMAASPTTSVEIDSELLERLRKRRPEKNDRELLESVARIQLGREASDRARERFAGVPSEEIEREAVKAAREVRRERTAERRTGS